MINENFLISNSAKSYYWKGAGLYSIKTFSHGDAYYNTGKGSLRVDANSFLLLNNNTEYSIEIDSQNEVHSFCIFFKKELINELYTIKNKSTLFVLDNYNFLVEEGNFFEKTYPISLLHTKQFLTFKHNYEAMKHDRLWLSQSFAEAALMLPSVNNFLLHELNNLRCLKAATRAELYKRLSIAKEYLHFTLYGNASLEDIARVSLLSLTHLLRCFKQVYGKTPHQYLIDLKIEKAKTLLDSNKIPVSEVCDMLGFESLGSFSNLFKARTGYPPTVFARQKR